MVYNVAACVYVFPWMGSKCTISFILIMRSYKCRSNQDMGSILYLPTVARSNSKVLANLERATPTTRPRDQASQNHNRVFFKDFIIIILNLFESVLSFKTLLFVRFTQH